MKKILASSALAMCLLAGQGGALDGCIHVCPVSSPLQSFDDLPCGFFFLQMGAGQDGTSKYGPPPCDTCTHCDYTFFVTFQDFDCDPPLCLFYRNSQFPGRYGSSPRLTSAPFGVFSTCDGFGSWRAWFAPCDGDAPAWADTPNASVFISCGCQ
jgi:hypothetical protein